MKKGWLYALAALIAVFAALCILFLCTNGTMPSETVTGYYEAKARSEAQTGTGAEAELMALLLGTAPAATEAEAGKEEDGFTFQTTPFSRTLALWAGVLALILLVAGVKTTADPALLRGILWSAFLSVPFGIFGARLLYCLTNISFFLSDIQAPEAMLKIWEGGLSVMGAVAFMALAGVIGAGIARVKPGLLLDKTVFFMIALAISTAMANDLSGAGYGPEMGADMGPLTTLVNENHLLATAFLTAVILAITFLLLQNRARKHPQPQGRFFLLCSFLFGCVMVPLESLRRDGHMVWGFVHAEMLYAMMIALPAGLVLAKKNRRIPLLIATALLAGAVIGLEFMLDRSAINDWLLYGVYLLCMAGYIFVGLKWANTSCEQAKNNV